MATTNNKKKTSVKSAAAKTAEKVAEPVKEVKTEAVVTEPVKEVKTEVKAESAKTTKSPAKKSAVKTSENVYIQYYGKEFSVAELLEDAKKDSGVKSPKNINIYVKLEDNAVYYVVDDDKKQKYDAERDQSLHALKAEPVEGKDVADQRQVNAEVHEGLFGKRVLKTASLNRAVDDLLRQIKRQKVRNHGAENDQQHPNLLGPRVTPNIT